MFRSLRTFSSANVDVGIFSTFGVTSMPLRAISTVKDSVQEQHLSARECYVLIIQFWITVSIIQKLVCSDYLKNISAANTNFW